MTSTADILDLNVGVRADTFKFELVAATDRTPLGDLNVEIDQPPTVTFDTSRPTFRTCNALRVSARDLAGINVLTERIRPYMILQNGARFNMGVLMFGSDARKPYSWGTVWTPELFDESFLVDQGLDQFVSISPGESILSKINALVAPVGLAAVDFSAITDAHAATAASWQVASSRRIAVNALFGMLGVYPPFFDNEGVYVAKPPPGPGAGADHVYSWGGRVIDGSTTITNTVYRAPNRYQVDNGDPQGAVVGIYDLPDSAPNSYALTGRRIVNDQTQQGIPSVAVANLAAYVNALTDRNTYIQATWSSTADPRHSGFDLCDLFGVRYLETGWSIQCVSGGPMTHSGNVYYPSA